VPQGWALSMVAAKSGRCGNHVFLDVTLPGENAAQHAEAQRPPTAVDGLTTLIERDDSARPSPSPRVCTSSGQWLRLTTYVSSDRSRDVGPADKRSRG
jgi:hypothetical protein